MLTTLKPWQNRAIVECIEESKCDDKTLIGRITSEAKIDETTAQNYLNSYRENPNEGAIGVIVKAVHKEQLDELVSEQKKAGIAMRGKDAQPPTIPTVTGRLITPKAKEQKESEVPNETKKEPADGSGKIAQILKLHDEGKTHKEIIERGFNKSTVYRQIGEYKKRKSVL